MPGQLSPDAYRMFAAELADLPLASSACPDCGDPSPGGVKCAACREWGGDERDFVSIRCCHCNKPLRDKRGTDLVSDIYSNEDDEDICATCYATDVEPFEVWSDDDDEVIGYDFADRVSIRDRLYLLADAVGVTHGSS